MEPRAPEPSPRKNILVVEDTEPLRRTLIMQLEDFGFAARGAADGIAGLNEVSRGQVDLVLCDLRMPRMDGLALLKVLRESHPDLPFIVMSGAGLLDDAISALQLGAWDYVEKPIPTAVLIHAVNRALERAALVAASRVQRRELEQLNRELRDTLDLLAVDEEAGRQIQFRMLPPNHQSFGQFEFSRTLAPAAFLSGDFIDAFPIDDYRHWGFYLADVCGHGVSSALVTVMLRTFVHQQLADFARARNELILSPARMLQCLNEEMSRDDLEKHVTIFYGIIDTEDDSLLYANAGQFPCPMLYDGKEFQILDHPGLPVGVMPRTRYQEHRIVLPEKALLAAFSDGLLEILPHPNLEGKQAFLRTLFGRPEITVEQVRQELHLDNDVRLPDDVAILLIKRGDGHGKPLDRPRILRPL